MMMGFLAGSVVPTTASEQERVCYQEFSSTNKPKTVRSTLAEFTNCVPAALWTSIAGVCLYRLAKPIPDQESLFWFVAMLYSVAIAEGRAKEAYKRSREV